MPHDQPSYALSRDNRPRLQRNDVFPALGVYVSLPPLRRRPNMPQVDIQAYISGHGKIRAVRQRPDEREQRSGGVRDGEAAGGAGGAAADEGPRAVGGYDGDTAQRGGGEVGLVAPCVVDGVVCTRLVYCTMKNIVRTINTVIA